MKQMFKIIVYGVVITLCTLWLVLLYAVVASAFSYAVSGTSVTFQSSDGRWGENEIQGKGREFLTIAIMFELYKIRCNIPEVALQRVTRKPEGFSFEGLFNDYSDPKWQVPLSQNTQPVQTGSFEPYCARRAVSEQEADLAHKRANAYINSLGMHIN